MLLFDQSTLTELILTAIVCEVHTVTSVVKGTAELTIEWQHAGATNTADNFRHAIIAFDQKFPLTCVKNPVDPVPIRQM